MILAGAVLSAGLERMYVCQRRLIGSLLRQLSDAEARRDAGRREGVVLAANTIRHHVSNRLGVTIGYAERLAEDPCLPHEVKVEAVRILTSARAAAEVVHRLAAEPLERLQIDQSVAGPALLDIEACTASVSQPGRRSEG
jgi:hypothetical protein